MTRTIDIHALVRYLRRRHPDAVDTGLLAWLERQPQAPELVGSSVAARLLGVHGPYVARLCKRGRLRAIPVEGARSVYDRRDVLDLAAVLQAERESRCLVSGGEA